MPDIRLKHADLMAQRGVLTGTWRTKFLASTYAAIANFTDRPATAPENPSRAGGSPREGHPFCPSYP